MISCLWTLTIELWPLGLVRMVKWIVDKRHVGTHGSCVRSNNHVYKLSIQLKPAFNGWKTSTPQPINRIAVSLFALVLCVGFINKSTKNRIAVSLFIGQCWHAMPTLSWGEWCESNAIGVAFSFYKQCIWVYEFHILNDLGLQHGPFHHVISPILPCNPSHIAH